MKRLCVFAHWDRDCIVDDYVVYYLKALKEVCSDIIFVSDCDLPNNELEKINDITDYIIAQKHGEYDFGSYKRGFLFAKEKKLLYDELIFANDSCYGPFYSLTRIFDTMSRKKCNYWGMTKNYCGIKKVKDKLLASYEPHIQSYFMVFKPEIFNSPLFIEFIINITELKTKEEIIILYEQGLNKLLQRAGFKEESYINTYFHYSNLVGLHWKELIVKYGFPFLKTSIAKKSIPNNNYEELISNKYNYPIEFIKKHAKRVQKQNMVLTDKLSFTERTLRLIEKYTPAEIYIPSDLFARKVLFTIRRFFRYIAQNL